MRTYIVRYTVGNSPTVYIWTAHDGIVFRFTTITKAVNWLDRHPAMTEHWTSCRIVPA